MHSKEYRRLKIKTVDAKSGLALKTPKLYANVNSKYTYMQKDTYFWPLELCFGGIKILIWNQIYTALFY